MTDLKKKTEHADEQIKNTNPSGENERDWADDAIDITTGFFDKYLPGVDRIGNPVIKNSKNTLKDRKVDDYNWKSKLGEIEKQSPGVNWGNSNAQPNNPNPNNNNKTGNTGTNNDSNTGSGNSGDIGNSGGSGNSGDNSNGNNNTGNGADGNGDNRITRNKFIQNLKKIISNQIATKKIYNFKSYKFVA